MGEIHRDGLLSSPSAEVRLLLMQSIYESTDAVRILRLTLLLEVVHLCRSWRMPCHIAVHSLAKEQDLRPPIKLCSWGPQPAPSGYTYLAEHLFSFPPQSC